MSKSYSESAIRRRARQRGYAIRRNWSVGRSRRVSDERFYVIDLHTGLVLAGAGPKAWTWGEVIAWLESR
jgi:hypothetical protein